MSLVTMSKNLNLLCSVTAANAEEVSGTESTLPAAIVSRRHHCAYAAVPRCFASARQDSARATLHFPVHWPASDVLCAECQPVEIWCECCAQCFVLKQTWRNSKFIFHVLPVELPVSCTAERLWRAGDTRTGPTIGQSGHLVRRGDPSAPSLSSR